MTDVLSTLELPLLERLRSQLRSLSPAERRVADTILRDPLGIIHMSVSELATLAETSAATVVRLCTSIGLRGYQELKITLATQSIPSEKRVLDAVDAGDDVRTVSQKVLAGTAAAVEATAAVLDTGELERIAEAILGASRIQFGAVGTSAPLAQDAAYRLTTIGIPATFISDVHGANFELKTSKFTPAAQTPILQAAAANKPDGIILSPVHQTAMQGPADAIAASGTPIITSNQLLTDSSNLAGVTKVDNYGAGVLAADYFAEQADGKDVKVAIETFTEGASKSADDELNGFLDQLEKYPNLTNVGTEFGDLEVSTYISATSNLLAQHPDLFGVFTTFAAPANGALASIAQNKSDTIVVGGYASKDENLVNALKDGRMGAIVDFDWYQLGYQTTEQMLAAIRDGEPQPEQSLGAAITTVDNIDDLTKADAGC